MKDESGRETRTWSGITLPGAELEISELVDGGGNSVVIKLDGKTIKFDLPPAKLVEAMAAAASYLREHHPKLDKLAEQIDREVESARRDQARFNTT